MASLRSIAILSVVLLEFFLAFQAHAVVSDKAVPRYMDGLDALNGGRWMEAASAFSRALEEDGDNPDIILARGVAGTLAEDFPRALKDLERVKRLGYRGREPDLWTYVAEAMSGIIVVPHHGFSGARGQGSDRPAVISIPGHVAQGGDDYSTDYASFIVYQLGMAYQKHRLPADFGGSGDANGTKSPQMRQAMLKAGQLFAEKNYRRPELASLNVSRAKNASRGSSLGGDMAQVERALASAPGDAEAHHQAAKAWLDAGRPATARKEFTIALTLKTDFPDAYLGRATAAAQSGDEKRTRADLEVYKKAGWLSTRSARSAVENRLSAYKAKGSGEALFRELQDQARSGKPLESLIQTASKLHRVAGEQRLRYDELYQDRLRELEDALRDHPKNPDRLVDLAAYLNEEADNRGEKVEPRREIQPYRFQLSREQELRHAIQIADRALGLNARHVGAIMQKAAALTRLKQYDQADKLADQALELSGNDPDALRLYAKFRAMRANQISAEAAGLRTERCSSSSHDENRSDGVYRVTTTTCYPPSQSDVRQAAQLDSIAAELRRRARAALERAAKVTKGTVDGFLILADLALWDGQTAEAQVHLEQAIRLDPKSLEAQDRLVQLYAQTGQQEKSEEQRLIAANLVQTTAAPLLRLAWNKTEKTAWQAAKGYLKRAAAVDPQDARIPAYLGVVSEAEDQLDEAGANYRLALALEEARLQLDEPASPKGTPLGRDALDFGLAIQARFHLARLAEQAERQPEALDHYQAVLGYERRMSRGFESRQMFSAMWPDQQPEKGAIVMAPKNAATLVAEAHLRTGKLLSAMGKREESIEHFRTAAMYGPLKMAGIPKIGNARGDTNYAGLAAAPAAEAQFYLAKELMTKGDLEGAQNILYEAGPNLPEHLQAQLGELNMAMARLHPRQAQDPYGSASADERPYVETLRRQELERQRMTIRHLAPRAKVLPEVVGRWELQPNNQFLPKKTLTIDSNADYRLVSADGTAAEGKMDIPTGRVPARGLPVPPSGQMMLYDERSGQIGMMWFEFTGEEAMQITDMDGTKYAARRTK